MSQFGGCGPPCGHDGSAPINRPVTIWKSPGDVKPGIGRFAENVFRTNIHTYDANARLRTITQAPLNPVSIDYDAGSRRTLLTLPNGVSTEYQYDGASRLTALLYRNGLGPLGDLHYTYDAVGNRLTTGGSFARSLLPAAVIGDVGAELTWRYSPTAVGSAPASPRAACSPGNPPPCEAAGDRGDPALARRRPGGLPRLPGPRLTLE